MLAWDDYAAADLSHNPTGMLTMPPRWIDDSAETNWWQPSPKLQLDDLQPQFGSEAGDVAELDEVVVTGERDRDDPYDEWWETGGWGTGGGSGTGTGGSGGGGGGSVGPDVSGLDGHQGLDCATNAIKDDINQLPTNNTNEHVAIVFRGADGQLYTSPPFTGAGGNVDYGQLGTWMAGRGIGMADIVGLYHNHPASTSTNPDGDLHRYPSNSNTVNPGDGHDWQVAGMFVAGANQSNASTFVLIVEDQNGDTRTFSYADRAQYENMTRQQMEEAGNLPPPTGACGGGA